jgi:hypothetical protein
MLETSPGAGRDEQRLGQARARRWWVTGRRVGSIERAGAFIDDVGFALLFPSPRHLLPSLWEAVAGADVEPFATGMNANEQKVWRWKDELPRQGLAWYGNLVAGRGSFLSATMLALLYPGAGAVDDHQSLELSHAAHEIAAALAIEPLPSAMLRKLIGDRNRYQRAIVELQRLLLVTNAGVHEHPTGWPSALLDLTCRRFELPGGPDHATATRLFLATMLRATPAELARTFRWPMAEARSRLEALVAEDAATLDGKVFRIC